MGFLDEFEDKKSLEVYSLGVPVFKINFDDFICIDANCLGRSEFVREYISKGLYSDVMNDILSQKPLKIDSKITKTQTGFIQNASAEDYKILYKVSGKELFFIEEKSGFKFAIRFLD